MGSGQKYSEEVQRIGQGLNIDVPTQPQYTPNAHLQETCFPEIQTSFYLINKDDYWLKRNFMFLHAFFAGTQWVHMPYGFIQGTNVYNVHLPGRFYIPWASIGTVITAEGKLRKNPSLIDTFKKEIKSLTEDVLFPDVWKIQLKIKSLTPNNFNQYIDYFVHGFERTNEYFIVIAQTH